MTELELISEKPITMVELKDELRKIKKRDETLNFRSEKTDEYLSQFELSKPKESNEVRKKLLELEIPRLKEEHICKILDLLPNTSEEVKIILQGYTITVSKDNLKRIADVVKDSPK